TTTPSRDGPSQGLGRLRGSPSQSTREAEPHQQSLGHSRFLRNWLRDALDLVGGNFLGNSWEYFRPSLDRPRPPAGRRARRTSTARARASAIQDVDRCDPTTRSAARPASWRARSFRNTGERSLLEQQLLGRVRRHHEALLVAPVSGGDILADDADDLAPH